MGRAVVLFSRDLRVRDNPALAAACARFEQRDPALRARPPPARQPNRNAFLLQALADLRASLGGALAVRRGDPVAETLRLAPARVFATEEVSAYGRRRAARARGAAPARARRRPWCRPPGRLHPAGADHYRVFTPFWRAWAAPPDAALTAAPRRSRCLPRVAAGRLPARAQLAAAASGRLPRGGETAGRERMSGSSPAASPPTARSATRSRATAARVFPPTSTSAASRRASSRARVRERDGGEPFLRQLCWRDFYLQLLAARPALGRADYRPRAQRWREDRRRSPPGARAATGYPVSTLRCGSWRRRARCRAGRACSQPPSSSSDLGLDWRLGAAPLRPPARRRRSREQRRQLAVGRGHRHRHPPEPGLQSRQPGDAVRPRGGVRPPRPRAARAPAGVIHRPWTLGPAALARLGYPPPIVDHAEASAAFAAERANVRASGMISADA